MDSVVVQTWIKKKCGVHAVMDRWTMTMCSSLQAQIQTGSHDHLAACAAKQRWIRKGRIPASLPTTVTFLGNDWVDKRKRGKAMARGEATERR